MFITTTKQHKENKRNKNRDDKQGYDSKPPPPLPKFKILVTISRNDDMVEPMTFLELYALFDNSTSIQGR